MIDNVDRGSPAARAGLQRGDLLTHVNGIPITGEAGWPHFNAIQPGETVRFTFMRGGKSREATMTALPRR
jgi:S1-C subfamily serine protease